MVCSTVLCVDDEPNVLKSLKRLLRRDDYEVVTCGSGAEAISVLTECTPEVIVSDQRMPGMTGTEFLAQAKEIHPDSVRVVLSGYADASSILESINRGHIFRFLTKPWDDEQLRSAIRQCVHQYEISLENRRLLARVAEQNCELMQLNEKLEEVIALRTRSLQFAQDVLYRLPMPVVGIDTSGTIAVINDAAAFSDTPLSKAMIGMPIREVLPKSLLHAVEVCLAGTKELTCLPVSEHLPGRCATVRRLTSDNELRGCLIAISG